jgi:uncharacterized protein (DUF1697 family)
MRVAFLRGINVGGHTVKKGVLCDVFLGLDLTEVATFIASGNVLFEPGATDTDEELEVRLAAALEKQLGWPVPIFVRSPAEIAAMVEVASAAELVAAAGETLQVGLCHRAPDADAVARLVGLSTPADLLRVEGRELYWLSRGPVHKSKLTTPRVERAGGGPVTFRNITTMRRLCNALAG